MVRNLSETGACLEVATVLAIPNDFTLSIPGDHIKRACRVAWKRDKRIGVTFS